MYQNLHASLCDDADESRPRQEVNDKVKEKRRGGQK
jgi:hypothetical protein